MHNDIFVPCLPHAKQAIERAGSPVYLTDLGTCQERLTVLRKHFGAHTKIFYAMKANYNPDLLRALRAAGLHGVDTVSPLEIEMALHCGFTPEQMIFTGNYCSAEELEQVLSMGVLCNIGSLAELELVGQQKRGAKVAIRLKPEVGAGEFQGTITGGKGSKFGIPLSDFAQVRSLLQQYDLQLQGLHCHIGSGFTQTAEFETAVYSVLQVAKDLPQLAFIDCGGGFGVRYQPGQKPLSLGDFAAAIALPMAHYTQQHDGQQPLELRLEPGKFLVAESTVLLCRVTIVNDSDGVCYVGTDTGFNHLIRPALYGAVHHVINLSGEAENRPKRRVKVVGNICQSSDILAESVELSSPQSGDILAFLTAGAYGSAMHSLYNLRSAPAEAILQLDGSISVSRKRGGWEQLLKMLDYSSLQ